MRISILTLFDSLKRAFTSTRILLMTETIFFAAPVLFLLYLVLISWQTNLGPLEPVRQNPIYTLYFIMFLSFFFCGFVTHQIRQRSQQNKTDSLLKLELLLLTASQFLLMNLFCAALLVWYIQREYGLAIFSIRLKKPALCFKNLSFIVMTYIFLVAIFIFILRFALKIH